MAELGGPVKHNSSIFDRRDPPHDALLLFTFVVRPADCSKSVDL